MVGGMGGSAIAAHPSRGERKHLLRDLSMLFRPVGFVEVLKFWGQPRHIGVVTKDNDGLLSYLGRSVWARGLCGLVVLAVKLESRNASY